MQEELVSYQGRTVPRKDFRVYVFSNDNASKLVNSYDEYEAALESGWFGTKEEVPTKTMVQTDLPSVTDLKKGKGQYKRG